MRVLVFLSVAFGLTVAAANLRAADATRFFSIIDDLPLMSAIQEVGDGVEFSAQDGRIAEVAAEGRVGRAAVLAFYDDTLPQLGWTRTGAGSYEREDEILTLSFEQDGDLLHIRFQLAPVEH